MLALSKALTAAALGLVLGAAGLAAGFGAAALYLVHREPDGTLIWEPAEVMSVVEAHLLAVPAIKAVVAANRAEPDRLRRRNRVRSPWQRCSSRRRQTSCSTASRLIRRRRCAGRIHTALDRLEADPGDARNRRRRFTTIDLWGIAVTCGDDAWLILWEPGDGDTDIVHHIAPLPDHRRRPRISPPPVRRAPRGG